jgi:DNA-binding MarR family transcriptional regulator
MHPASNLTVIDFPARNKRIATRTVDVSQEHDLIDELVESIAGILPGLNPEVEGLVDRIACLSRRFHRALNETLAEFDLDYAEWQLLGLLARRGAAYRSSPGKLARMMELTSGGMTKRLDRLERGGLLRRLPDPNDRRGIQVELTAEGSRLYEDAAGVQITKEELMAAALSDAEKKQLNALLRRLMLGFERADPRRPGARTS